jgi:hypothetical protein
LKGRDDEDENGDDQPSSSSSKSPRKKLTFADYDEDLESPPSSGRPTDSRKRHLSPSSDSSPAKYSKTSNTTPSSKVVPISPASSITSSKQSTTPSSAAKLTPRRVSGIASSPSLTSPAFSVSAQAGDDETNSPMGGSMFDRDFEDVQMDEEPLPESASVGGNRGQQLQPRSESSSSASQLVSRAVCLELARGEFNLARHGLVNELCARFGADMAGTALHKSTGDINIAERLLQKQGMSAFLQQVKYDFDFNLNFFFIAEQTCL